jgi:exosortase C (VPDSG-CTERM-specific)
VRRTLLRQVNRLRQTRTVVAAFYLGAIALMFGAPLVQLCRYALHSDVNSHVVLVPFVCAYLLRIRRSNLANASTPAYLAGISLVLIATFVWAIAVAFQSMPWLPAEADRLTAFTLSLVLYIWAGGFLFLGRNWMRSAAFPVLFLIFMVPLPSGLVNALESASKLASAEAANLFFVTTGTPTLRDGNIFQLPGITLEVAQECSGIRSSYVLVLTSLVAGNLFLTKAWSRILLVSFVIPLGIIRNGFRVWFIGQLCIHMGPQVIDSIIHRRGGPVFFILSLVPLLLLVWCLRLVERQRGRADLDPVPAPSPMPVIRAAAGPSQSSRQLG